MTDGTLDPDGGEYPLSHAVLGGRHLRDEYYVVYATATEARDVADALQAVDWTWLRRRFDAVDDPDYRGAHDDADFDYAWDGFVDVSGVLPASGSRRTRSDLHRHLNQDQMRAHLPPTWHADQAVHGCSA